MKNKKQAKLTTMRWPIWKWVIYYLCTRGDNRFSLHREITHFAQETIPTINLLSAMGFIARPPTRHLTPRENQVLFLLNFHGHSEYSAARKLGLHPTTVRGYRKNAINKMDRFFSYFLTGKESLETKGPTFS